MTNQTKTNNLIYLIDSTFREVNLCCHLKIKVIESYSRYYTPTVEIKKL